MAEYGVDEYTIRVSTLEEVFIEIGRKESAKIEDNNNQLLQQAEVITGGPPIKDQSCWGTYRMLQRTFFRIFWQSFFTCGTIIIAVFTGVFLLVSIYLPTKVSQPVLNYSSVADIYPDYAPLNLMYN